jgi:glycine dehydrogenase subunit 1
MALLGPQGLRDLGETIMYRANYAMRLLSRIKGVKVPIFKSTHFKEFTVNFDGVGLSVKEVNERLLKMGVHGGKDISKDFPEFGETSLYCVTEIHSKADIELLAESLEKIVQKR